MKDRKNPILSEQNPQSNRTVVERDKVDIPNTQIHGCSVCDLVQALQ